MADFVQMLDPSKLVLVETVLSFVTAAFEAPPYNFPLFLFGTYAQESTEAAQSSQTFTVLLAISFVYDIVWMARHHQNWFTRMVTIIVLILKLPTALAFAAAIRQRGVQFSGVGFRGSNDVQGATVWSMPGGFTSGGARDGYQSVDEPSEVRVGPPKHSAPAPQAAQPTPGAYQSV